MSHFELETIRPHIDRLCYLDEARRAGVDIDAKIDYVAHFHREGWKRGINPNRWFSVKEYLSLYPDVKSAGVDPFYHFLVAGKAEGRLPRADSALGGDESAILKGLRSLEEDAIGWYRDPVVPKAVIKADVLSQLVSREIGIEHGSGNADFVVSFSHDNFLSSPGGMQVCIKQELLCARSAGVNYIHLFPYHPQPRLGGFGAHSRYWGVSINGRSLGYALSRTVIEVVGSLSSIRAAIVHSLLGFNEYDVLDFCKQLAPRQKIFWVHDYFSFCESWTLSRNKITHCASPALDSAECVLCYFGETRETHVRRMRAFLRALRPVVLCPSGAAEDRFLEFSRRLGFIELPSKVIPHYQLSGVEIRKKTYAGKLKVAFLGHPAYHKGWSTFMKIFREPRLSNNIEFYHFGDRETAVGHGLLFRHVNTSLSGADAMTGAIRTNDIDICIIRPEWPETFGITALEAVAGGARVITSRSSGGIYEYLSTTNFGDYCEDVEGIVTLLLALSSSSDVYESVDFPGRLVLEQSRMSFNVL